MRKGKLLSGKRFLTFFSLFILSMASFNAWAQQASEYCWWRYGTPNTGNAARFTWTTEANGNVTITIHSGIEGETAGQTTFRGQGWTDARVLTIGVDVNGGTNYVANTGNLFFTKTLSADKSYITLIPAQTIPVGAKIRYNNTTEYLNSLNGNAYNNIDFVWTYGSTKQCADPGPLAAPENVAVDASSGLLTFNAVANASSYVAYVYSASVLYYTQAGVEPTGTALTFTEPGAYTVKVKAIGDDDTYLNSVESGAAAWTIAGEIPPPGDSEICYSYWAPSTGNEATLSWETLENGNITVTMTGVNGNGAAWRGNSLAPANFKLGPQNVVGTNYLDRTIAGNVCTITPKAGVTFPSGMQITYQGEVQYSTTNGNQASNGNFTYTYGTDCSALVREKLDAPENVVVDNDGVLTFNAVDNAATYNAFVYLGADVVYRQPSVASGDVLNFPLPGTFHVRLTATPDVTQLATYEESDLSAPFVWTVNYRTPTTVVASSYCAYLVNPNGGGNSIANSNAQYGDYDATYWSWTTDAEGQIVIAIDSAVHAEYTPTTKFRANGMPVGNFLVGGVPGNLLLEKVGGNTGNTQTFKAREGITLLPGIEITFSGQVEYLLVPTKPADIPGSINDLYPTLSFSTAYIYGSNCSGEAAVLPAPENLAVTDNALAFEAVENASAYKIYVYDTDALQVHAQANFASGDLIAYNVPGHYTVKAQAIGNAAEYINSALSESTVWDLTAALAKPSGLKINTENKLTFTPVPAAVSYTVTVYESVDDPAVETITEFESGSQLDMGEANYGKTYYVKVQAIGDGDVILDSEPSDAYTWNFEEPYVCNLLLAHPLIPGTDAITFTKPDGSTATTAPYFAPDWKPSNNYTFSITDNVVTIHLGAATGAEWQAQFRVLPQTPVVLKAGASYDIKAKVKTSKNVPVYAKIFDYDDNAYFDLVPRQNINDQAGKVFELSGVVPPANLTRIFQILFDFGGNPADTDIEISDMVICGEEGTTVGIENITIEPIGVYPIPAKNILYVNGLSAAKQVRIVDVAGKAVLVPQVSKESFDVSGLSKGIYILSVDGQAVKFTKN